MNLVILRKLINYRKISLNLFFNVNNVSNLSSELNQLSSFQPGPTQAVAARPSRPALPRTLLLNPLDLKSDELKQLNDNGQHKEKIIN